MLKTKKIALSGLMGSGKTTLATKIGKNLGMDIYYEPVDNNPYLPKFYDVLGKAYAAGKEKRALIAERDTTALEFYLVSYRYKQQQQMSWNQNGTISDRSIYEDQIFAEILYNDGILSRTIFDIYMEVSNTLFHSVTPPDVLIYLHVSPEEALRRITIRNRGIETGVKIEYLRHLYERYEKFIEQVSEKVPVLKVDWENFRDTETVVAVLTKKINDGLLQNITEISFD